MAWIFIAYLCGLDLVIFGMGAEPFYVPDTRFEIDGYDQSVLIAFDVEYIPVAPYIIGTWKISFQLCMIVEMFFGHLIIPCQKASSGISIFFAVAV
jgi:hypothetical protein